MANLTTTADIKTAALNSAGELTNGNSDFDARIVEYINRMNMEVCTGGSTFNPDMLEPWDWSRAKVPGILILKPPYSTGSVSLTNGSASGTFSSPPPADLTGYYLKVIDRAEFYRIITHSAGNPAFTIDAPYTEASGAFNFTANKLDYTLTAGIARLIDPMRIYRFQPYGEDQDGKIYGISYSELSREYPLRLLRSGTPTRFSILSDTDGTFTIRFNTTPSQDTKLEYDYIPFPTALTASPDTTPILPREDRDVLLYGAVYWLMVDKNDSRADTYFKLAQSKLQNMLLVRRKQYGRVSKYVGRLIPRIDQVDSLRRPRTEQGLFF